VEHTELVAPGVAHDPEVKAALLLVVIAGRAQRLQALDLGFKFVEKLLTTNLTSTDTTERNASMLRVPLVASTD
jgi:hypothetical protein